MVHATLASQTLIRIGAAARMLCESTATTRRRAERGDLHCVRTADNQMLFYLTDVASPASRLAAENPRASSSGRRVSVLQVRAPNVSATKLHPTYVEWAPECVGSRIATRAMRVSWTAAS
jgi:hypothetical protein